MAEPGHLSGCGRVAASGQPVALSQTQECDIARMRHSTLPSSFVDSQTLGADIFMTPETKHSRADSVLIATPELTVQGPATLKNAMPVTSKPFP